MHAANVLISGAGVAGATLAYWLARHGLRPTIVERSAGQRSSGNPVDVRGPALPVVEAMGVLPALREAATNATRMAVLDAAGRQVAVLPLSDGGGDEVEVPRADLAGVLHGAARDEAEILYDDTITALDQDEHGIDVTFERSAPRRFDLVIGADGLHSAVRRITFGPEQEFARPIGLYVATTTLTEPADDPRTVLIQNAPGRMASVHPGRGRAISAFIFRGRGAPFDAREPERQKAFVAQAYAGLGWRVPELIGRFEAADDVFFDAVSVVDLPSWSRGRITLLGDAASCVSLLGDGSSLAIAGASTLAGALAATDDHGAAFAAYERSHRPLVSAKQRGVGRSAAVLVPKTRTGLAVRNLIARVASGSSR